MEEIKINMKNLSDSEREQLMALIEKANKSKNKIWKPEKHEIYYFLSNNGMINVSDWKDSSSDNDRYAIGNVFYTEEEAGEEIKRRKILTKWERLSIESNEDNDNNTHWIVRYNYYQNKIAPDCQVGYGYTQFSFPTKKSLLDAIEEIGEDNVKKYILNIKD